jgi:hypothetical protein
MNFFLRVTSYKSNYKKKVKMLVINLNNNQSKKKAWMRENQWMWHVIHTDTFAITKPVFGIFEKIVKEFKIAIGCNSTSTSPQGPPV